MLTRFVGVGVGPPPVMVKFASEISKKMLPTASTLMRAVVVPVFGMVTDSVPSFGVLARSTVGKVIPPSVEREIFTLAALTGTAVVLATFQVTVKGIPPVTVTAVFGAVTPNGPLSARTFTAVVASLIPPPPARLSRTVTRNCIVRVVVGMDSPLIKTALPGPKAKAIIERDGKVVSPSYTRGYPFVMARGSGAIVEDVDGNQFLDCAAGIAVNSTGVSHPEVVKAIADQAAKFIHMSGTDFYYEPQVRLAEELASLVPIEGDVRAFFATLR